MALTACILLVGVAKAELGGCFLRKIFQMEVLRKELEEFNVEVKDERILSECKI